MAEFEDAVTYPPTKHSAARAHIDSMEVYKEMYERSINDSDVFWGQQARETLHWSAPFDAVQMGGFEHGDVAWFVNGKLNASVNCLDRHIPLRGDKTAIIWEADEPGQSKSFTYKEVLRETCRIANALKSQGVRRGDAVTIYMPMVPELAFTMLACTRIGAPHSIVFAGFSANAVASRIVDCKTKFVVTSDEGLRGGRVLKLKAIVDEALTGLDFVEKCFVFERTGAEVNLTPGRDVLMKELLPTQRPFCPAEAMDSEDILFLLYTSGSTGAPKGVAHSTAGYLLWASLTHKYVFDLREDDVYACVADCGWITGHSYIVYGPLCNGATTVMFESTPLYPNASRYWDMVETHKITQFYTAPTAIRALIKSGEEPVNCKDVSSLRVLGTVGEPINPEAWRWYHTVVGKGRCSIVDTYWQTETGGHMVTPLPGCTPTKPGSATLPFFGIDLAVLNKDTGEEVLGNGKSGVLAVKKPWPGMARTVFGDHERYLNVYMRPYKGFYFTGDGCHRDKDGYYWVTGRVDDVLNISGHRIGSAEIESALVEHAAVAEAAVVGYPHDIKGMGMGCYCILKNGVDTPEAELVAALRQQVRKEVGPFATPDFIIITPNLPTTRSGKIMRRLLRKILANETAPEQLGDVSTLKDPSVVQALIAKVSELQAAKAAKAAGGCK